MGRPGQEQDVGMSHYRSHGGCAQVTQVIPGPESGEERWGPGATSPMETGEGLGGNETPGTPCTQNSHSHGPFHNRNHRQALLAGWEGLDHLQTNPQQPEIPGADGARPGARPSAPGFVQ